MSSKKNWGKSLILGGCGFIGSYVAEALLGAGYTVRIFDKIKVNTKNIDHIINDLEMIEGDFNNEKDVARAIKGIDYIFHFIGTTLPKTSTENPIYDLESNVISTLKLLNLAVQEKIKKIIFSSSGGTVYGVPQTLPIVEEHPTNPTSAYGISKLMIEKYLELYHQTKGLDYVIFRIANLYGERQDPRSHQGAVAVFLGLVKEGKPITIWGKGSISRDYIYIKDIIPVLINALVIKIHERIYNLGSGKGTTLNDLIAVIKEVTSRPVTVAYAEERLIDVPINVLDISRAQKQFAFSPHTPLREGVQKTWQWLLNQS
ncbi:MAG TPA: NAD-dependent epimerase/dehydratase family protein [Thermodesulfobacteriota bacterium]|nr:NAD-dependent epimerase/dehydratase family protein [Thermodesulfobacteriota bacterium]